ncbi:PREDICTED: dihydroxyacetone phosphate acyltransferase-like [Nanorana parkeri]|uniref:dihydroxyacetone phosphate acyltransferase-like n=1 Tax=Nanorana parkeri TaxID=125878 RepID=UPI000854F8DE|nr:PREDICTED: dihydroxyacetone phosphate acyltransferase-like [Nanorana parkeri]
MAAAMGTPYSQREFRNKKRDAFEDILEERRQSSDLRYAMKCYSPVIYRSLVPCKPSALKTMVLHSEQLQYVIKEISLESGESCDVIQDQAAEILDEMGQNLNIAAIRMFALTLSKIFKALFQKVCVNEEGMQRLAQAIHEHPVVLLPSHRSYIDFLMMSYILYTYDLALPVIAAGMDFMNMKIVGELLRMSGAFFMRRTFRGNKLYWAVFAKYVKTMLRNGYAPVEFFVEGQRSRTCKTLNPKFGLLSVIMEPFFKGEVFDTYLVPISISYERILEESLYAYELLGVPKPKESTSGLIKARKILSENFGSIHVFFGKPMSLRSLASGILNRSQYNLIPRCLSQKPSEDIQKFISDVAYKVELHQIANMVLSPGCLIAAIVLQNFPSLSYNVLVDKTLWLKDLTEAFGGYLEWPDNMSASKVVRSSLDLHSNITKLVNGEVFLFDNNKNGILTEELVFSRAVAVLMCASYRNHLVNIYVRPALVVLAMKMAQSSRREDVYQTFDFLRNLFSKEFIFFPGFEKKDFEEGCLLLSKCDVVQGSPHEMVLTEKGSNTALFLLRMFQPFFEGYQLAFRHLVEDVTKKWSEKQYISALRSFVTQRITAETTSCYEALSSDMQKNTLASFVHLGLVKVGKLEGQSTFTVNETTIEEFAGKLGLQVPVEKLLVARL